jgi:hypothetical protein
MLLQSVLLSIVSAEIGLSKTGAITIQPKNCQPWGEGLVKTEGCLVCLSGFKTTYDQTTSVWSNLGSKAVIKAAVSYEECKKVSFVCSWSPFGSTTRKDQRTDLFFVDSVTKQETQIACNIRGRIVSDLFYIDSNSTTIPPYAILSETVDCKTRVCTKYSLFDLNNKQAIEIARLGDEVTPLCTTAEDGACYNLRVIPSPSGKLLAVVLLDDVFNKGLLTGGNTFELPSNHKVIFLDTEALIKGNTVIRGSSSVHFPKFTFAGLAALKWDTEEKYFGMVGYTFKTPDSEDAPRPPDYFANFFVDQNEATSGVCTDAESLNTCICNSSPTASSYYRIGDGMKADDFITYEDSKELSYNCGKFP